MRRFPHRVIFWACCCLIAAGALAAEAGRRVLLVHSFGRDFAPFSVVSVSFRTELTRLSPPQGILQLLPDLRHLHVVHGTAPPLDRYWAEQLRREWPPFLDGVEIHWLGDKSLPDNHRLRPSLVLERIHPAGRAMVREAIDRAPLSDGDSEVEYRIECADGEVRWISSRWRPDRRNGTGGASIRGVSIDVTDRKHAEAELAALREELIHLNRATMLGELSGVLSHELNQPLGAILSNAQSGLRMLARNEVNQALFHEILSDIAAEGQRAASDIKHLRALLQRGVTSPQPIDPNHCIDEVLALLETSLIEREVEVSRQFALNLPKVHADPIQLQQVMLNLLGNACEAIANLPPGERLITVRTGTEAANVSVEVRDNGKGFSATLEDYFLPFHTTKHGGLGMGLTICKSVIDAHHGEITAASPAGGGATVRFTLPAMTLS